MSEPVYDSRTTPNPYQLTTTRNGHPVDSQKPMADPFHFTTLTLLYGWRSRLAILFGRREVVTVNVRAPRHIIEAVLELDANYRGMPGSARRAQSDAELQGALAAFVASDSEPTP